MRAQKGKKVTINDLYPIKFKHGSFGYEKEGKKLTFSDPYPSGSGCYLVTLNDAIKYVGETVDFKRRIRNFLTPGNRKTARRVHENIIENLQKNNKITFAYIDECEMAELKISLSGKAVTADQKLLERYIIAYTKSNHLWNRV